MRVTVVCFARLRDLAGLREWSCELPAFATAADAWQALAAARPAVVGLAGRVSCALNAEFVPLDAPLKDGDEVAFLPPVSGGACRFPS
jgi:molybdopterin converting factor subunit 1